MDLGQQHRLQPCHRLTSNWQPLVCSLVTPVCFLQQLLQLIPPLLILINNQGLSPPEHFIILFTQVGISLTMCREPFEVSASITLAFKNEFFCQ